VKRGEMMNEYKIVDNYVLFKELHSDTLGKNYRAGEISGNKPKNHKFVTDVHPFFFTDKNAWDRINILLEGIKKSNIPHLYSPEKITKIDEKILLIFPYIKARTFEQLLEDSEEKNNPINFDLAFSIALSVAELIDVGSSIVVSGKKSYHGFLTPDNILVDYDGNIFLKNYGICPYIDQNSEIFSEIEKKYGAWLTPEFLRKEKIVSQSDIYHLGYILFRMLTGKYFSYTEGEDFNSKFENLSFTVHIPSTETDFLTNIINFFKKTLNPDPMKRFNSVRDFKDYITNYFHIEELSSITFNLAYFMNSLYSETMEKDGKVMSEELAYVIPEEKEEVVEAIPDRKVEKKEDSEIVESILNGLDEKKKAKTKPLIPIIIISSLVIIIGIIAFLFIGQQKKAEEERLQALQEQRKQQLRLAQLEKDFQDKLKTLQEKATTTEAEQLAKEEEIANLKAWKDEQEKIARQRKLKAEEARKKEKEKERLKKEAEEKRKKEEEERRLKEEAERKKKEELERKKREEALKKPDKGDLLPIKSVTKKPEKIKGKDPKFSSAIRRKYKGKSMKVRASLLIDETGKVAKVRILGDVPADIKAAIVLSIADWKYTPASKNNVQVKVWHQVPLKISFE
jgi:serine/threonine protein kinase